LNTSLSLEESTAFMQKYPFLSDWYLLPEAASALNN